MIRNAYTLDKLVFDSTGPPSTGYVESLAAVNTLTCHRPCAACPHLPLSCRLTSIQVVTGMRAYAGVPTPLLPHRVAVEGLRPSWPEGVPGDLVRLAEACWVEKPQHRWGVGSSLGGVWVWVLVRVRGCCPGRQQWPSMALRAASASSSNLGSVRQPRAPS